MEEGLLLPLACLKGATLQPYNLCFRIWGSFCNPSAQRRCACHPQRSLKLATWENTRRHHFQPHTLLHAIVFHKRYLLGLGHPMVISGGGQQIAGIPRTCFGDLFSLGLEGNRRYGWAWWTGGRKGDSFPWKLNGTSMPSGSLPLRSTLAKG